MDALVEEEFVTTQDFHSGCLSLFQKCGFNRRVDRIAYPSPAFQPNTIECVAFVPGHAEWRAIDEAIRILTGVLERWCNENVHAALFVSKRVLPEQAISLVSVEQFQRLCSQLRESKADRFSRAAAARDGNRARKCIPKAFFKGFDVPGVIGVQSDRVWFKQNSIAGANRLDG